MQKVERLVAIEKLISDDDISSQDELMNKLKGEGISCTQATLSRNLRQLGVLKVPNGRGGYRYSLPGRHNNESGDITISTFSIISVIKSMINANSMIIMKTKPGHASSVAVIIDNAERYEVAGTIAGDDTLLIIPRDNIRLRGLHDCLELIIPGLHDHLKKA